MKKNLISVFVLFSLISLTFFPLSVQAEDVTPTVTGAARNRAKEIREQIKEKQEGLKERLQEMKEKVLNLAGRIVSGEVTAINGTALTVSKDGKTYTVNTDNKTKFRRRFWGNSQLSEFSVGNKVNVWGKFTDEEKTTILAKTIRNLSIEKRHGVFFGTITSKGTGSFVLKSAQRGDQAVTVSGSTKIINRKQEAMTFDQLNINDKVRVKGLWDRTLNTLTEVKEVKDFTQPVIAKPSVTVSPTMTIIPTPTVTTTL